MPNDKKITPEQFIATQFHLMFCNEQHAYDMRLLIGKHFVDSCPWYLEEQIHETWEQPVHARFLNIANAAIIYVKEQLHENETIETTTACS